MYICHSGFSDHPPAVPIGSIAEVLGEGGTDSGTDDISPSSWRSTRYRSIDVGLRTIGPSISQSFVQFAKSLKVLALANQHTCNGLNSECKLVANPNVDVNWILIFIIAFTDSFCFLSVPYFDSRPNYMGYTVRRHDQTEIIG